MPIFNLYSKRQKALRGEIPDVYTYNEIPQNLRIQVVTLIKEAFGTDMPSHDSSKRSFGNIYKILCREYFELTSVSRDPESYVLNFILKETDVEKVLSAIEICFRYMDKIINEDASYEDYTEVEINPEEAIKELNERFKEHGIGFQFDAGEIIRVDSTFMHSEVVKPTLLLLSNKKFQGALDEYLKAHENYSHGRNKECLSECLKAFESTMKTICVEKKWTFSPQDTAKKLI